MSILQTLMPKGKMGWVGGVKRREDCRKEEEGGERMEEGQRSGRRGEEG